MRHSEFLKKQISALKDKMQNLRSQIDASQSLEEVRNLTAQLEEARASLGEFEDELRQVEADNNKTEEHRGEGMNPQASFSQNPQPTNETPRREGLDTSSMEYRQAFMEYVQRGTVNSTLIERAGGDPGFTITPEIGMLIPDTMLNEIIQNVSGVYGTIYNRVRHMNIKGGVSIPIGEFKANAYWINETTVSPRQKAGESTQKITFSYYTLEIRVANSLLTSIVSLPVFEEQITRIIVEAWLKEIDTCIINGDGDGKPLGITQDERVTNEITMTEEQFSDWASWHTQLFAKVPLALRGGGEFIFPVATVEKYLRTMKDDINHPIYSEAAGLNLPDSGVTARFNGRPVLLVEPDIVQDFDTAGNGDVIGIFWNPQDYIINTNLQFGMRRYFDEETNQYVTKAIVICDGKIADTQRCWLIKKSTT